MSRSHFEELVNLPPMAEALEFLAGIVDPGRGVGEVPTRCSKRGDTVRVEVSGPNGTAAITFELAPELRGGLSL